MYIYSVSMRIVWQEDSAKVLLHLLKDIPSETNARPFRAAVGAALGAMQLQQIGLVCGDVILKYEQSWTAVRNPLSGVSYPASIEPNTPEDDATDPYRQTQPDRYRLIDLFIAGEAELYSLGYFSVGASKPHNRLKLALLFRELSPLQPRVFWWRVGAQAETFSKKEIASLGFDIVE